MLILLPPSESKAAGGGALTLDRVALTFGTLNPARDAVRRAYEALHPGSDVLNAPTMPAIDRYKGTLFGAIHGRGLKGSGTENNLLGTVERERAKDLLFVQSALFGLIPATGLIPNYKLSAGASLPGLLSPVSGERATLRAVWAEGHESVWRRLAESGPIIDLRSRAYADLAPIPAGVEHFWVEVLDSASGKALNHFNKKSKGELVRAVLQATTAPASLGDLADVASSIGLRLKLDEVAQGRLLLLAR